MLTAHAAIAALTSIFLYLISITLSYISIHITIKYVTNLLILPLFSIPAFRTQCSVLHILGWCLCYIVVNFFAFIVWVVTLPILWYINIIHNCFIFAAHRAWIILTARWISLITYLPIFYSCKLYGQICAILIYCLLYTSPSPRDCS